MAYSFPWDWVITFAVVGALAFGTWLAHLLSQDQARPPEGMRGWLLLLAALQILTVLRIGSWVLELAGAQSADVRKFGYMFVDQPTVAPVLLLYGALFAVVIITTWHFFTRNHAFRRWFLLQWAAESIVSLLALIWTLIYSPQPAMFALIVGGIVRFIFNGLCVWYVLGSRRVASTFVEGVRMPAEAPQLTGWAVTRLLPEQVAGLRRRLAGMNEQEIIHEMKEAGYQFAQSGGYNRISHPDKGFWRRFVRGREEHEFLFAVELEKMAAAQSTTLPAPALQVEPAAEHAG